MTTFQMRQKEVIKISHSGIESCKTMGKKDKNLLLVASRDHKVHIVRLAEDQSLGETRVLKSYEGHKKRVRDVEYSSLGDKLISVGDDNKLIVRDREGTIEFSKSGHSRSITGVVISPDNTKIVTGSEDGSFIVWNTLGDKISVFDKGVTNGHKGWINACGFMPGSNDVFVTGSDDGTVKIWDIDNGTLLNTIFKGKVIPHDLSSSSNKDSTEAKAYDFDSSVKALAFAKEGSLIAYGGRDGIVYLMNMNSCELLDTISVPDRITALAFGENLPLIAIAIPNRILLWNIMESKIVGQYDFAESSEHYCRSLIFIENEVVGTSDIGDLFRVEILTN